MVQPRIIFLGTAGDSFTYGKQQRASGGIIIQAEDCQFHIDPGPGALVRAMEADISIRNNTAILASHNHVNHCNDINAVIAAMTHNGLDRQGVLIAAKSVFEATETTQPTLSSFHKHCLERFIMVDPGKRVGIEEIEIRAITAFHNDPHTVGFKFFTPKFTLTYSSDTRFQKELIDEYDKSDILILNTVYPRGAKEDMLSSDDVVNILEKTEPELTILTHFGIKMLNADPLSEARDIQKKTKSQVIAAKEGMVVNPLSYSATLKQKTLNLYQEKS